MTTHVWQGGGVPARPWVVVSLSPVGVEAFAGVLEGLAVRLVAPGGRDREQVRAALQAAEIVLGDFTGELGLDAQLLAEAPRLCFVQQPSVGVDSHDGAALAARGVPLAGTAGANAASVAEWVVGAVLALRRGLCWVDAQVRLGRWPQAELLAGAAGPVGDLAGQRVGIVGFGAIGQACARRLGAFDTPVSYWSRQVRPSALTHGAGYVADLDELCRGADVLILAVALAPETVNLLDARRLELLPPGALVVNAARGEVLDEGALRAGLAAGRLGGAALDVYREEPLPPHSPWRDVERVLLSAHVAGATPQAVARVLAAVRANLLRATTGVPVVGVTNGADPLVRRRSGARAAPHAGPTTPTTPCSG